MSDPQERSSLRCPECGQTRFRVPITAIGEADITFREDDQEVADNFQVAVSWRDTETVTCLNCEWTGPAQEAAPGAAEQLLQRAVRYLSTLPQIEGEDPTERIYLIKRLRNLARQVT